MAHVEEYLYDLREARFVLFEHLRVQRVFELPAFADFEVSDIELLLAEGLRFAQKELSSINASGDREGCRWDDGKVTTPAGFRKAYRAQFEHGWMSMSTSRAYGGQGLP